MLAFLLMLVAVPVEEHPSFLTGSWFGQGEPHDKTEMWLAHALPNGDFAVQFRACRKGQTDDKVGDQASDLVQKGKWWFRDGIETVQITWSTGLAVFDETPYKILFHDGNHHT